MENALLKQIFSIPLDNGKYLIYAPLKGIAFVANRSLVDAVFFRCREIDMAKSPQYYCPPVTQFRSNSWYDLETLHNLGFFQPEPLPVDIYLNKGVDYDAVILFLTNQCSLRCSYCYASSGDYPKEEMPWEIARAAIDFVVEEVKRNRCHVMTLGFHGGGEPTLNWDVLRRAVAYARSAAQANLIDLHVTGSFNGYWPTKVLRYVVENFTEVSLSMDGLPHVQNLQRPPIGQGVSFPRVAATLRSLDEANFPYGIRMTVTDRSVGQLGESIAFVCENFRPQKIQVEPVFMLGRALNSEAPVSDLGTFIDQFIRGFRIAQRNDIEVFYSGARIEILTQRFCLAACRALVVTSKGDITTCFETYSRMHPMASEFIVGRYNGEGFSIDEEKRYDHFSKTVSEIPYCDGCFCKWHCAGDCFIKTHPRGVNHGFQPTERCYVNQELTKFLTMNKITKSGGLVWINQNTLRG